VIDRVHRDDASSCYWRYRQTFPAELLEPQPALDECRQFGACERGQAADLSVRMNQN
jgi:hypothetical protein